MEKTDERYEAASKLGEIIIGKQRNGPLDDIPVSWTGHYTRFDNLDTTHDESQAEHF